MRLGVLDVGSNTVHLLVVDAHPGAAPLPAASVKTPLRLAQLLSDDGSLGPAVAAEAQGPRKDPRPRGPQPRARELPGLPAPGVRGAKHHADGRPPLPPTGRRG